MDEFQCGKNTIQAAKEAGVQHLVLSTLPNVDQWAKGRLDVPHFTNKAKVGGGCGKCAPGTRPTSTACCCAAVYKISSTAVLLKLDPAFRLSSFLSMLGSCSGVCRSSALLTSLREAPCYFPVPLHPSKCLQLDAVVRSSGFKHHTFVMPAFYFQNFAKFHFARLSKDGTVLFSLPMAPTDMLTAFDVDDTGAAVVNALNNADDWNVSALLWESV